MKVIACLGNPEKKYLKTRHNIGFIIGRNLAESNMIPVTKKMFLSLCGNGKLDGTEIFLLFPETYMNSSGEAAAQALNYYRETASSLIVIHDEIEMPFGQFNTRFGGGHRGHNGLRSIIAKIGSPDFHRLRFGVGRSENPELSVADHVLSDFFPDEMAKINEVMPKIHDLLISLIKQEKALNE